jgi:hypothetical protein
MSVGVMEDYKLRDLRASHTLGRSWNWNTSAVELVYGSLLWIDKARAKDKRYKEVSVW